MTMFLVCVLVYLVGGLLCGGYVYFETKRDHKFQHTALVFAMWTAILWPAWLMMYMMIILGTKSAGK